jgi:dethiobiotin synthetase
MEKPAATPGLFITGTDTGVGKTVVTAAIARAVRRQGCSVRVCKPVATGAVLTDHGCIAEDTRMLADAAGETNLQEVTPWAFSAPAAPPVAARLAGVVLELEEVATAVRRRLSPYSTLLVEGVGGLLCPLTEEATVADLMVELDLPVVIVVRRSLGTLNHTLLTLEAARRRGLDVCGLVVCETEQVRSVAEETNVDELRRLIDVPLLAVVPYRLEYHREAIEEIAAIDWRLLTMPHQIGPVKPAAEGLSACRR